MRWICEFIIFKNRLGQNRHSLLWAMEEPALALQSTCVSEYLILRDFVAS